jgi:hypothetical protein
VSNILIHIGYAKSGSCFLGEWFHKNPAFIFKDFKIAGFESTSDLCKFAIKKNNKIKYFVIRDMLFSSPKTEYMAGINDIDEYQQKICMTLYKLFPDSKILIVTRGFESAIKANYSQYLKEGGFQKFEKLIEKNKKSNWLPYNYSSLIGLYNNIFGFENVLVIPFELLKIDACQFLGKIEDFLDIEKFVYYPEIKNQSLSMQQMALIRKVNKIMFLILFITGPFQPFFYKFFCKFLDSSKTKTWNNLFVRLFSKFFKPMEFDFSDHEFRDKFSNYADILSGYSYYSTFKKDYFLDE